MKDSELIYIIATIWIHNGGDSEGFIWCQRQIADKIKELETVKE